MIPEWQTGIVKKIEHATPTIKRFFIELPDQKSFDFKPGQFVTLDLPIHEQRNKRWRSYSIASAPDNSNIIELIIVLVEGGLGSAYLFNEINVGSELTLRGPQGVFVLPQNIDHNLLLICTGTGIAPFRSMLKHLYNHPQEHKNIHLIFGTRTQQDLLYYEELKAITDKVPNLFYHPVLSREKWEGEMGYVHEIYEKICTEKQPAHFMLCGWKAMIEEAKQRIQAMSYDKKSIHQELYG